MGRAARAERAPAAAAGVSCVVCGSAALRPYLHVETSSGEELIPTTDRYGVSASDIVGCSVCGHAQLETMPAAGELKESYEEAEDSTYLHEEAGQRATAAATLSRIERHATVGSLCDLGCWTGFLVSEASRRGWDAWGVEPSHYAAEVARDQLGLRVIEATIRDADLPQGRFDAVVMADVIEHLPEPGETLDRIRGLLAPGGVLYLAVPDAGSAVARRLGARWWSVLPTHVQYFSRASVARLLDRHAFAVEWLGTAPKTFTVRYYLGRLGGYSSALGSGAVTGAERIGLADRLITPDFRDRMGVLARMRGR